MPENGQVTAILQQEVKYVCKTARQACYEPRGTLDKNRLKPLPLKMDLQGD